MPPMTIADIIHWMQREGDELVDEKSEEDAALFVHVQLLPAPHDSAYDEGTP